MTINKLAGESRNKKMDPSVFFKFLGFEEQVLSFELNVLSFEGRVLSFA